MQVKMSAPPCRGDRKSPDPIRREAEKWRDANVVAYDFRFGEPGWIEDLLEARKLEGAAFDGDLLIHECSLRCY